jgi:hypothetical protein
MSDTIDFHKTYTRQSRSPWSDLSRVAMLWNPESKGGIYLQLGDLGINGFSLSKEYQERLPEKLKNKQYIKAKHIDVVMHIFAEEIQQYCVNNVKEEYFKEIFLINQSIFFSDIAKKYWLKAYNSFIEKK